MKFLTLLLFLISFSACASAEKPTRRCQPEALVFTEVESADAPLTAQLSFYGHREKPSQKSILIMPPTGGTNYIDRRYAEELCQNDFDVYILNEWSEMSLKTIELNLHQRYYSRAQRAITLVLNSISSDFIGMLGTSLGGLHTSVSLQVQPRLDAAFIITGGVPIIEVIMNSDQEAMIKLKKLRKEKYNTTSDEELKAAIEKTFSLEPTALGEFYQNKKVGVAIALNDRTVPTANQQRLIDFFQPQTVLSYSSGHFWGIVKTWLFDSAEVVKFFNSASDSELKLAP